MRTLTRPLPCSTPISRQLWAEGFDDSGNYTNISTIVPWTKFSKVRLLPTARTAKEPLADPPRPCAQGVLLHFDETLRNQPPTSVPWIAMISCDTNGTNPSDEDDIFTITRDLGAQAALLYSLTSEVSRSSSCRRRFLLEGRPCLEIDELD